MARGAALGVLIVICAFAAALTLSPPAPHVQRGVASAQPSPSPQSAPTNPLQPLHDYGPPPAGIPLIYAAEPANLLWLTAFDWQGNKRGTVKLVAPTSQFQAPAEWNPEPHCFVHLDPQTADEVLYTQRPGEKSKRVGIITREQGIGQTGVTAAECNFQRDLAIAVRTAVSHPTDTWAVRLSDGTELGHWSYANVAVQGVVPSTDGSLLAEVAGLGGLATRIRSVPDGAIVASLPPADTVLAFSDDNRLALVGPIITPAPIRVIEWRTGREVWRYKSDDSWPGPVAVQPGGGDLVLAIGTRDQAFSLSSDPLESLVIVHSDGSETDIPGRYRPVFPPYADGNYPAKGGV